MNQNFYAAPKRHLVKTFKRTFKWFRPQLNEFFGEEVASQILQEAEKEYERLIPLIPFVGGSKVHMTEDLMESVQLLAYLRVLKAHGKTLEECKEVLHRATEARLSQYPRFVLKLGEIRAFSKPFTRYLASQAKESRQRKYSEGFVFDFVPGDGEEFAWGLDIHECGIYKFFQEQDATEFMSIVCSIDYILSDKLGYGLARTETIAEGAKRCNPRLKRGRPTEWR